MALRWAGLVTVAITGPRTAGSPAPQTMGTGLAPWRSGCEVSEILAALARAGRGGRVTAVSSAVCACESTGGDSATIGSADSESGHPVGVALNVPFRGDFFPARPEVHPG